MDEPHVELTVVVPCFNEAARITHTIASAADAARAAADHWEVLIVDDSSTDGSAALSAAEVERSPGVRCVPVVTGKGKGAAVRAGVGAATGEWVLVVDADLAGDMSAIAEYLRVGRQRSTAAVIGNRLDRASVITPPRPRRRRVAAAAFRAIASRVLALPIADPQCGFKLYRRDAVLAAFARSTIDGYAYEVEILDDLIRHGSLVVELPIRWSEPGDSAVRVGRDGLRMLLDVWRIRNRRGAQPRH